MLGAGAISTTPLSLWLSSSTNSRACNSVSRIIFPNSRLPFTYSQHFFSCQTTTRSQTHFCAKATSPLPSAGSAEYVEEPATKAKFQTSLTLPACSSSLTLVGTGYREKVFAIIGVKVYAAGLYLDQAVMSHLNAWKGQSADVIQGNFSLFKSIFQSPSEKSLQIILVRDVDGKTFWDALDDAISPRIKAPSPIDEIALSEFCSLFQNRPLKKGTFIFLTWLDSSKLLVSVSSQGIPSTVDATIESANVTSALFDVFLGDSPVSPTLKASASEGLSKCSSRMAYVVS